MTVPKVEPANGSTQRTYLLDVDQAGIEVPATIVKRDGRIVPFDIGRIESAMARCFASFGRTPETPIPELARRVVNIIAAKANGTPPTVEGVQDIVEMVLQAAGEFEAAKRYILYRAEQAKKREKRPIPEEVRRAFAESDQYFPTPLQKFQFFDKYARFNYELGRRETWIETVDRSVQYLHELAGSRLPAETYERIRRAILEMRAMPSMRLLAMAGPAARRNNVTIYNCSYQPVESIDSFVEALTISMSGCGVGYSVESRYVENFPRIKRQTGNMRGTFVVDDSAEGWADALRIGLETWFDGGDIRFDLSQLRPAGAPLRTKGGRASGPEPLRVMLEFVRARILARQGSFLRAIDAHDMMCAVGNAAVSGGVRRTAMLALFDYDDDEMRLSKSGDFERENSQRWNANNSAVWPRGGLTQREFIHQFMEMVDSGRGEPGIFNREAANSMKPARRPEAEFGTNPCGEIILRPWQFCNLTAAVARQDDTFDTLREKVEVAAIIGTIQSLATHFPGLRPIWRQNCEEERLLGVDITGQMDSPIAQDAGVKAHLREIAVEVNRQTAAALHINQSAAVTCVKPSGNCRPWYSLTSTSAGLLTLQELFADHPEDAEWAEIQGDIYALQGDERARISRTYNNGVSPTVRIRMSYGLVVESTPQHRWFVAYRYRRGKGLQPVNEWIMAADLCPDDVLDVNIGAYTNETHAPLAAVRSLALKMRGNATPIQQPVEMNEDIAWLLGYLWGDGCLSPGGFRIRFVDNRQDNLLKTQRILREQFGLETTIHAASEKRRAWVLEVASVYLWHWLIRNNAFKYFGDQIDLIPQCVRASARNDIIAFLAGLLDSDGWSGLAHETRAGRFTLSSADRTFAQHVQDVSWAVGVPVGCSLNDVGDNLQNRREMYLLTGCVHMVPDAFEVLLRNSTKLQATASLPEFTRWEWQTDAKRNHVGKIIEITPGDYLPTYDVEVEGNHWFYAGAVKSHNSSQLLDCSSGLHARWAPYYIRNVRVAAHSPIFHVLRSAGVPMDPENGQTRENANTWVVHFPVKAPEGAITRKDRSAIDQCEYWLQNKLHWTEHNPSCTITYHPDEVLDLMKWVWEHRDTIGGLTFLPAFDANYAQMPYMEITKDEYEKLAAEFPDIDFSKIYRYEEEDLTTAAQELACSAGICEVEVWERPTS